jgi:hypothetical protein
MPDGDDVSSSDALDGFRGRLDPPRHDLRVVDVDRSATAAAAKVSAVEHDAGLWRIGAPPHEWPAAWPRLIFDRTHDGAAQVALQVGHDNPEDDWSHACELTHGLAAYVPGP